MKQRFTSRQTSINSRKAPAVYSMPKAVDVMTGKTVVDIGGGRFDTAQEALVGRPRQESARERHRLAGQTVERQDERGKGRSSEQPLHRSRCQLPVHQLRV